MTLTELIAKAGSVRPDALPAKMRLIRPGSEGQEPIVIDYSRPDRSQEAGAYLLQEGDIVFLPTKGKGGLTWSSIRDVIWTAGWFFR